MQVPLNWLRDYIDLAGISDAKIAELLTSLGLEVEHTETKSHIPSTVVLGKVLHAEKHPNADSLRVCKVLVAEGKEPLDIVCGAPNARADIFVAVALVGTEMPDGLKIKEAKIRGEKSCGMMCSAKELRLAESHDGIIEIDPAFANALGRPAASVLGVGTTVLTLNVTPNRGDCLSIIGVARDLAGKLGRAVRLPKLHSLAHPDAALAMKVNIEGADACSRFMGMYVKGVSNGPSPEWLKTRVEACGMRSINAIVDISNYVMMEFGQPVHFYDARHVENAHLVARFARPGESVKTLDAQVRTLGGSDLVIADAQKILGLAGVMGGAESEVRADTSDMLIEVATFDPSLVRKTAKKFALHSEASKRFERGIDIGAMRNVLARLLELLTSLSPGLKHGPVIDIYPKKIEPRLISLRLERVNLLLGTHLTLEQTQNALTGLGFRQVDRKDSRAVYEVPTSRNDIEREVDLIEEIARVRGYETIPYTTPHMSLEGVVEDPFIEFVERSRAAFAHSGLHETISFPFMSKRDYVKTGIGEGHALFPTVMLQNPLSSEESQLRTTLAVGLLQAVHTNRAKGDKGAKLFEAGRGFFAKLEAKPHHFSFSAAEDIGRTGEKNLLAGIIDQPFVRQSWSMPEVTASFFHARDIIERWAHAVGLPTLSFVAIGHGDEAPHLHPKASAWVYAGDHKLGWVGELHPKASRLWDFGVAKEDVPILFEIDLEAAYLTRMAARERRTETKSRKFPPASRDMALLLGRDVTHARVVQAITGFPARKHLTRHRLFDVYAGKGIAEGQKSMAYALEFESQEKTLTDQEVETEMNALVEHLSKELGATRR